MGVNIEIGELSFTGFGRVDTERVAESFQRELTRLLTEHPVRFTGREIDLVGGVPPLPPTRSARGLGQALARAVHSGLIEAAP
ncbi:hypothetical protein M8C13_42465 [Crossiella sp. SN42]|uniref:hypothetical protein n=1 Tax=Crossiella sp. SN42 TaxID=2944808 RepID=UPI00207D0F55|nr:hypothetical protein [Crossiella sp. SN42]MCO1582431.1 hypothetical protein [Crossiella sp. SN42]